MAWSSVHKFKRNNQFVAILEKEKSTKERMVRKQAAYNDDRAQEVNSLRTRVEAEEATSLAAQKAAREANSKYKEAQATLDKERMASADLRREVKFAKEALARQEQHEQDTMAALDRKWREACEQWTGLLRASDAEAETHAAALAEARSEHAQLERQLQARDEQWAIAAAKTFVDVGTQAGLSMLNMDTPSASPAQSRRDEGYTAASS